MPQPCPFARQGACLRRGLAAQPPPLSLTTEGGQGQAGQEPQGSQARQEPQGSQARQEPQGDYCRCCGSCVGWKGRNAGWKGWKPERSCLHAALSSLGHRRRWSRPSRPRAPRRPSPLRAPRRPSLPRAPRRRLPRRPRPRRPPLAVILSFTPFPLLPGVFQHHLDPCNVNVHSS